MKRVFLIVLDSFGIGAEPDADRFGDVGTNTLRSISRSDHFRIDNLKKAGLCDIEGVDFLSGFAGHYGAVGRLREASAGKDTTIGHWEIAGLISPSPMPTYPHGFPDDVIAAFSASVGRGVLCNLPYSGTKVIEEYGEEHMKTGKLIVYTSADSVFQIAAHEDIVPVEELYDICRKARSILKGRHAVGRVIARPFKGGPGGFYRTENRRDFSLEPTGTTLLDELKKAGRDVISVGKIRDIFASRGVTEAVVTHNNTEGMAAALELQKRDFNGLCFVNLVDFDMLYGHRNDADGYAKAIAAFDEWLPGFVSGMREGDALIITADHGCDPGDISTDHTREYVPMIAVGKSIKPVNLGTRSTFADVGATVGEMLGVKCDISGKSFYMEITSENKVYADLMNRAEAARNNSYSPYSGFSVGAALLCSDGKIYEGCNIENASFSPTICAERTAIFKAVSEGEREFEAIAISGGRHGEISDTCSPCGVCRQVMTEFCGAGFKIVLRTENGIKILTLKELMPLSFTKGEL